MPEAAAHQELATEPIQIKELEKPERAGRAIHQ
jgi:hypothetical protein